MQIRTLVLGPLLLGLACSSALDPTGIPVVVNGNLESGKPGTIVTLTNPNNWITGMTLSADYLYFAVPWSGIYRMPKYGGDVIAIDEDSSASFEHLAADAQRVFWDHTNFGSGDAPRTQVRGQTLDGAPTTTLLTGSFGIGSSNTSSWFQAVGGYVLWAADTGGGTVATVERVPAEGGVPEILLTVPEFEDMPAWIGDGSDLYFTSGGPGQTTADCTVQRISGPEKSAQVIAACPTPDSFAVGHDDEAIYVQSPQAMWKVGKQDGAVSAIATLQAGQTFGWGVAFDASNVYANVDEEWVTFPKSGGPLTTVADRSLCSNVGGTWAAIAVDADYVYLLCGVYNQIVIVPNPATP